MEKSKRSTEMNEYLASHYHSLQVSFR